MEMFYECYKFFMETKIWSKVWRCMYTTIFKELLMFFAIHWHNNELKTQTFSQWDLRRFTTKCDFVKTVACVEHYVHRCVGFLYKITLSSNGQAYIIKQFSHFHNSVWIGIILTMLSWTFSKCYSKTFLLLIVYCCHEKVKWHENVP